nr:zinc finger CCCH domain-containing protein 37 isoform X2 [Tanacetum cinerariifolium]
MHSELADIPMVQSYNSPQDKNDKLLAPYIAFGMLSEVFKLWIKGCNIIILDVPLLVLSFNRSFLFWWLLVAAATAAGMDAGLIMLCFRSILSVDEETRESLRDTIALLMREELEKLRDEMRKCSREFLGIMREQVDWVLYKESILLRFHQNKEFMSDNVKDLSCGLHVIDKVGDLLVNINHCEVNLGISECAHNMFDEKSIKEILKQDTIAEYSDAYIRESIEVGNRRVEDVVVETAKVNVEMGNEVVDDDKMGDDIKVKTSKSVDSEFLVMEVDGFVTDRNRSKLRPHKNNGSFVHRIKDFHLFGMYVGTGYIEGWEDENKDLNVFDYDCEVYYLSRKALLGAKEFFVNKKQEEDFDKIKRDVKHESVKELVDGSNGLVEDKLLASNCGKRVCDLGGSRSRNVSGKHAIETNCKSRILVVVTSYVRVEKSLLGSKEYEFGGVREMTFSLEKVLEYSKRIREPVRYEVRKGIKENKFVPEEVHGQCTLISLNLMTRHETCTPTKKRIRDLDVLSTRVKELVKNAKESSWPMKSGVNCIIIVSVEGASQLNHLDLCQSIGEKEEPEADIEVPEQVDTKVPRPVLKIVDNELVPERVSKLIDTKAGIEEKLGSQSHMTSFSDLGFSDSSFSDLSFSDLSSSDLSESHTKVGMQLAGNKTISGNSSGLGHLKSVWALLHNSKGLPIRPGEADCPFYLKTGSCKYCATCRYNHPERYVMVPPAAIAATPALRMNIGLVNPTPFLQTLDSSVGQTTLGLGISIYPQRPGQLECDYYKKTGACMFGER